MVGSFFISTSLFFNLAFLVMGINNIPKPGFGD
jgi:hypothetical protein